MLHELDPDGIPSMQLDLFTYLRYMFPMAGTNLIKVMEGAFSQVTPGYQIDVPWDCRDVQSVIARKVANEFAQGSGVNFHATSPSRGPFIRMGGLLASASAATVNEPCLSTSPLSFTCLRSYSYPFAFPRGKEFVLLFGVKGTVLKA